MLLRYLLYDFEVVPAVAIITGISFVFTFYMRCISVVRSLYFRILSALLLLLVVVVSSSHRRCLRGTSLEASAVTPTADAPSVRLQYFPCYMQCSKYSCFL